MNKYRFHSKIDIFVLVDRIQFNGPVKALVFSATSHCKQKRMFTATHFLSIVKNERKTM